MTSSTELQKILLTPNLEIVIDPIDDIESGIVFIYAEWSDSKIILTPVIEHCKKVRISKPLYIFQIDSPELRKFGSKHQFISHGRGEIFRLENGMITSSILQPKKVQDLHAAIIDLVKI